ncbi:right-handed parallel beta-helix repeat-containing protein [Cohnella soli]|uniref:Nitrous oxide reductase family maturation protein NosD n=1 Tax=Cohnella soli TaxID=425005 RepID=A0ABW0HZV9_9BACL
MYGAGAAGDAHAESTPVSLQALIDAAQPGDEIALQSGRTYAGPATVNKPVSIVGNGDVTVRNRSDAPALTLRANGVTLQGFRVDDGQSDPKRSVILVRSNNNRIDGLAIVSQAGGIYLREANGNVIVHNRIVGAKAGYQAEPYSKRGNGIDLLASTGNLIQDNEFVHVHDGVYVESSNETRVIGNKAFDSRYGFHIMFSGKPELSDNVGSGNVTGGMVMGVEDAVVHGNRFEKQTESVNSQGILLFDVHRSTVEDNRVEGNRVGLYIEKSSDNIFSRNEALSNFIGIQMIRSEGNTFTENVFVSNVIQAQATESRNNALDGNYWDDYRGLDVDGDGHSDLPYEIDPFFLKITDQVDAYQLFFQAPGLPFLTQLFRDNTDNWLKDSRPLMSPSAGIAGSAADRTASVPYAAVLFLASISIIYLWGYKNT